MTGRTFTNPAAFGIFFSNSFPHAADEQSVSAQGHSDPEGAWSLVRRTPGSARPRGIEYAFMGEGIEA